MKNFLIKIILISLPLFIVLIAMEFFLRNIPNDYSYKNEYLSKNANSIETLILGSSHAYYGFDPMYFSSKTFNASHISQSIDYDVAVFRKYQSKFNNLKTVIFPISYFTLYGRLEKGSESWRLKNYVLYYGYTNFSSLHAHSELLSFQFNKNKERLFSYYFQNKSAITCSELGWGFRDKSLKQSDLIASGKTAAERHTKKGLGPDGSIKIMQESVVILENFVKECNARGVKVLFITLPAYKNYVAHLDKKQLNEVLQVGKNLDTSSQNVLYLNLLEDTRFVSDDFQDADHLSANGAKKLSKIVNAEIGRLQ